MRTLVRILHALIVAPVVYVLQRLITMVLFGAMMVFFLQNKHRLPELVNYAKNFNLSSLSDKVSGLVDRLPSAAVEAKVVGVSDGDTIKVLNSKNEEMKIRFYGIDAPESRQAFGQLCKKKLSEKIFNKTVEIQARDKDQYGRTIAKVLLDGKDINLTMIEIGCAWHYKQFSPTASDYAAAEVNARSKKVGLWADANPVAPWTFRKNKN